MLNSLPCEAWVPILTDTLFTLQAVQSLFCARFTRMPNILPINEGGFTVGLINIIVKTNFIAWGSFG